MAYIKFTDVFKIYSTGLQKINALDGMNFEIERGEFCVIVGPSGAGKSTLLNILGGMDSVTSGSVLFDGKEIGNLSARELTGHRRNNVGFVFQSYNLVQNLTAKENIELALELCRDSFDPMAMLKEVGLEDRADNFPSQLSGGEQQRVSIARALAKNPDLILCDEPTGALDTNTGTAVLKVLLDTCKKNGKTVVVITHNSEITKIADRVIRIKNGKATGMELCKNPLPVEQIEW
ncbi:MAG: ABC transporter ATP-binding protein [Treponema sp.]|nr:ABC transporter ATP-binding protein [Treponema sp.]MBQ2551245.1 ABC transporter ATP-binding protein [Treponema sp.]